MANEITETTANETAVMMEKALLTGDLSKMTSAERLQYYSKVCASIGLNPYTQPFDYIILNGKLKLYAKKDTTEQLRKINKISLQIVSREFVNDLYIVTAKATDSNGRSDEAIGAVNIANLKGDALANAIMKSETKAKRRVTLSIAGLGWLDETEVESIPDAKMVNVTPDGEIVDPVENEINGLIEELELKPETMEELGKRVDHDKNKLLAALKKIKTKKDEGKQ
jgi:hypothetical protein